MEENFMENNIPFVRNVPSGLLDQTKSNQTAVVLLRASEKTS